MQIAHSVVVRARDMPEIVSVGESAIAQLAGENSMRGVAEPDGATFSIRTADYFVLEKLPRRCVCVRVWHDSVCFGQVFDDGNPSCLGPSMNQVHVAPTTIDVNWHDGRNLFIRKDAFIEKESVIAVNKRRLQSGQGNGAGARYHGEIRAQTGSPKRQPQSLQSEV